MNDITKYITEHFRLISVQMNTDGSEQRETYEGNCFLGKIRIRLGKNLLTGQYYQLVQYQVQAAEKFVVPILWKSCMTETFWNQILSVSPCRYEVYSSRIYRQPKLKKPKEISGINSFGSACYIRKHCSPKLYLSGNDLWLKHTDYFSSVFCPEQNEQGKSQNYYLEKYFDKSKANKFTYTDNWGAIVLRNEAWIVIRELIPLIYTELPNYQIADIILESQIQVEQGINNDVTWRDFWKDAVRVTRNYLHL